MHFWDWRTGYNFQRLQASVQPGSLDSEAGIFAMTFDLSSSLFITCEADKTIKIYKEDDTAVSIFLWLSHNCFKKELSLFIHKLLIVSETEANDTEIFLESFQKVRKFSSAEMQTIQLKITEIPGRKTDNPGKKYAEIWAELARLSSFPEIVENVAPLASGNLRKCKPEYLVE